jgi:hypothetical protein
VYRARGGAAALVGEREDDASSVTVPDVRDYDADHYERLLRDTFATRLARAFTADDYAAVFADPDQLTLFAPALDAIRPVLTPM